jgi:16S rRNA (guanine966-N2)-methyltransferase
MNIIAGLARNLELVSPPDMEVRPTTGRARKALFDSLGSLEGLGVLDLCAGSGAAALEAASRGASLAVMVEKNPAHVRVINSNVEKVRKTGVTARMEVVNADILNVRSWLALLDECSLILADPPYAVSADLFRSLMADQDFLAHAEGCFLVWEIPDTPGALGEFLSVPGLSDSNVRKFGGTLFLMGTVGA